MSIDESNRGRMRACNVLQLQFEIPVYADTLRALQAAWYHTLCMKTQSDLVDGRVDGPLELSAQIKLVLKSLGVKLLSCPPSMSSLCCFHSMSSDCYSKTSVNISGCLSQALRRVMALSTPHESKAADM